MKYVATVADQTFEIEIIGENRIKVDGQELVVDLHSVAGQPVYSLLLDGDSWEACVQANGPGMEVVFLGRQFLVQVEDERRYRLRQASSRPVTSGGEWVLKSPMPGLIVSVRVAEGERVAVGQDLVVLESMKMQNVLKASREGLVRQVRVRGGDRVEQDQILLTVG